MLALPTRPKTAGKVILLPLNAIQPSPWQARTVFDETEIAALAVSILQNGLLQPVTVRKIEGGYQLIAGERRLRACRLAKLEQIPAILGDYDDRQAAALGLLENLQRQQLDPFDTARGLREVIRLWGCTQAEAARRPCATWPMQPSVCGRPMPLWKSCWRQSPGAIRFPWCVMCGSSSTRSNTPWG